MKTWARIFAVLLAAVIVCAAFGGCGKSKSKGKGGTESNGSSVSETGDENNGGAESGGEGGAANGNGGGNGAGGNGNGAGTANGNGNGTGTNGGTSSATANKGKIDVVWWCSYDARKDQALQTITKNYNAKQSRYRVKCLQMGSTEALITKLMSLTQKSYPALFNGTPYTLADCAESDFCVPIQNFIDKDSDKNWINDFFPAVLTAYKDRNGKLIGMPVGLSITGMSINLDILGQVKKPGGGYYSLSDCTSYEKIAEIAIAAKKSNAVLYGISFNRGTNIHDMLRVEGVDIINNGNGWTKNATKSLLNEGATKTAITKYAEITAKLFQEGAAYPQAGVSGGWTYAPDFNKGRILFWENTNSYIGDVNANVGIPKFKTAWIPSPSITEANANKNKGQMICEGTGVFIADTGDNDEMQGAYEYLKYLASVEAQEIWCTATSYVPYTRKAADSSKITSWQSKNFPEAGNVISAISKSSGALKGTYGRANSAIEHSFEAICTGLSANPKASIQSLIDQAHKSINNAVASQALNK